MIPPIHITGGDGPTIFVSSVQSWSFLLLILDNVEMAGGCWGWSLLIVLHN